MIKSISETLYAAADLLEPEGRWTQGVLMGENGSCFCMMGAIAKAGSFDTATAVKAFKYSDLVTGGTISYNDHPNRTQSEVVAKLREAGDRARERGSDRPYCISRPGTAKRAYGSFQWLRFRMVRQRRYDGLDRPCIS